MKPSSLVEELESKTETAEPTAPKKRAAKKEVEREAVKPPYAEGGDVPSPKPRKRAAKKLADKSEAPRSQSIAQLRREQDRIAKRIAKVEYAEQRAELVSTIKQCDRDLNMYARDTRTAEKVRAKARAALDKLEGPGE